MAPNDADDDRHEDPDPADEFRCAFVTLVGRPNVGKSSLVNAICGAKVSIVSDKPQTTRHRVRGIYNEPERPARVRRHARPAQAGHGPRARVNATAIDSVKEADATVDVVCLVVDATAPLGAGDRWVAGHVDLPRAVVVVNKVDRRPPDRGARPARRRRRARCRGLLRGVGRTGDGLDGAGRHLVGRAPEGPAMFPHDVVRDVPPRAVGGRARPRAAARRDPRRAAVLDRHPRVSEWEGPHVTVEILVERESQKGMVIGKGGRVLKQAGERARAQLPEGTYLELRVKVDKDWQQRPDRVERLGY